MFGQLARRAVSVTRISIEYIWPVINNRHMEQADKSGAELMSIEDICLSSITSILTQPIYRAQVARNPIPYIFIFYQHYLHRPMHLNVTILKTL